ncbi:hypothetical protein P7L78_06515 [Tistrella bauzanensis]|uniref:Paeninodin family lasso peptide n=1 Tax=Tistrella arctica TaxID=3133430 RepID=A0ABU9YFE0_9PROT
MQNDTTPMPPMPQWHKPQLDVLDIDETRLAGGSGADGGIYSSSPPP